MKDQRLYGRFTHDFPDHAKIMPLSDAAFRCLVEATLWSCKQQTDGLLARRYAVARWSLPVLEELSCNDPLRPSLQEVDEGWLIRDYADHQQTRAEIDERRERNRIAGQKGGQAKSAKRSEAGKHGAKHSASEVLSEDVAEEEKEVTNSRRNSASSDMDRIDVRRILEALMSRLSERDVKTPKSLDSWATDARRLLDIDKRPLEEVLRVLEFSQTDSFWQSNILSMRKFRTQYDQLRLRMGDWKPTAKPEDRIRNAWRNGFDAELSRLASEPFTVEWPDPMPEDRDAERLQQWRNWLENHRPDLLLALERAS